MAKKEVSLVPEKNRIKDRDAADIIFHAIVVFLSILCFIVIMYPLWFVVIASISNSDLVNQGKVVFWPQDIRFYGFEQIFQDSRILIGYRNTLIYVVGGTLLNMIVTMPAAYALSRPDFRPRNAIMLYFVNNYEVLVTDEMMGNVINTQYSEASGFFSWSFVLYVLLLGVLPSVYVFARKVEYGSWKQLGSRLGIALAAILVAVFGNMKNWPWIDRNSTELGSLLMPWSYIVNTFRYYDSEREKNVKEIPLPDATAASQTRDVCVLMIGESARRDHFSLYGYPKETNPYTVRDSVVALLADASATYTSAGVRAILEPKDSRELYEILPNYLERAGVDVSWRTSNWGEPPVHTEKYIKIQDLREKYPDWDVL